jgi:hypothetical protein
MIFCDPVVIECFLLIECCLLVDSTSLGSILTMVSLHHYLADAAAAQG